jgi:hypothetical protein
VEHESEFPALKLERAGLPILYSSIYIVRQIRFSFHDAMRVGRPRIGTKVVEFEFDGPPFGSVDMTVRGVTLATH